MDQPGDARTRIPATQLGRRGDGSGIPAPVPQTSTVRSDSVGVGSSGSSLYCRGPTVAGQRRLLTGFPLTPTFSVVRET